MEALKRKIPAAGKQSEESFQNEQININTTQHPYLEEKGIDLAALQAVCPSEIEIRHTTKGNFSGEAIFRELLDAAGTHRGFERILSERIKQSPDDKKGNDKFVTQGGTTKGTFTPIGFHPFGLIGMDCRIIVCAGLAEGYRIHEATGEPVACGVGDGVIRSIVEAIQPLNPNILVAVDNDDAGKRAGKASGCKWTHPTSQKDWSDVYQIDGLELLRKQLAVEVEVKVPVNPHDIFLGKSRDYVQLPESFRQTTIGKLAKRVSHCIEFPEASAALTLLTGASAAVATSYAVQYASETIIPAGLFSVVEQPPSMQKSRLLSYSQGPYLKAMGKHNEKIREHNHGLDKNDPKAREGFTITTDPTSAGLDMHLADCSEGRFFIASAEQAAFQSLFPENGGFASHTGLLLQSWAGEYASAMRKGRAAFSGYASGSVMVIAQPGSSKRVFDASNGTGLAERFFYMGEPSPLGSRTLHGDFVTKQDLFDYNNACTASVDDYSNRRMANLFEPQDPEYLHQLTLKPEGYQLLLNERRRVEPELGRLNKDGEFVQVGWLGKIETHTLKVAAVLHVVDWLGRSKAVPDVIPTKTVQTALDFVLSLAEHLSDLLHDSGETGEIAEVDSIMELVTKKPYTARSLCQAARHRHPFRGMGKDAYSRARARIEIMTSSGMIRVCMGGKLESS